MASRRARQTSNVGPFPIHLADAARSVNRAHTTAILRCSVLLFSLRNNPECVVRQRPLQRKSVRRVRLEPAVDFRRRCQNDRHGLRVDRSHDSIGLRRKKSKQLMFTLDRRALWASHTAPGRPQAREGEERPILAQSKPGRCFTRLRIRVIAKRGRRDHAAVSCAEPSSPMGLLTLRMFVTGWPPY
jgi:hypothetical protein